MTEQVALYNVPRNSRVRLVNPKGEPQLDFEFGHIDGMFSFCVTDDGDIFHIAATTMVVILRRGPP